MFPTMADEVDAEDEVIDLVSGVRGAEGIRTSQVWGSSSYYG